MPFPTVKSDPYKKGLPRVRRSRLWSDQFWSKLIQINCADLGYDWPRKSQKQMEMLLGLAHLSKQRDYTEGVIAHIRRYG